MYVCVFDNKLPTLATPVAAAAAAAGVSTAWKLDKMSCDSPIKRKQRKVENIAKRGKANYPQSTHHGDTNDLQSFDPPLFALKSITIPRHPFRISNIAK